jgi:hypothetical protein
MGIYSGGLGVLAGDHCKSASDMALPFVGVGPPLPPRLLPPEIDADGHQEHAYPDYDPAQLPLRARAPRRRAARRSASSCPAGPSRARSGWPRSAACRSCCSTPTSRNDDADRPITHILYVRGREMRLHQELVLGVGGVRALRALGIEPRSGTSTRATRRSCSSSGPASSSREPASLGEALRRVGRDAVFTIHTPVSAGNERFGATSSDAAPAAGSTARASTWSAARARRGVDRRPERPVRHDRLLAAPDQRRERGQPAPRRDGQRHLAVDLAGTRSWPSPTASTRRPGSAPGPPAVQRAARRRPRQLDGSGSVASGSASSAARRGAVGGPPAPEARADRPSSPAAWLQPVRAPRRGARPCALCAARSTRRPDHRLRAPLRDLQARRAALQRRGAPGAHPVDDRPAGPDRLRRQGPPGRPAGPARDPGHLRAQPLGPSCAAASSSSRTTTCASGASSSRASTSG